METYYHQSKKKQTLLRGLASQLREELFEA